MYGFTIAVDRFLRDLRICFAEEHCLIRLPSRLFRCETLETLELQNVIFLEIPPLFSLPSLRTLRLLSVKCADEESFCRIVSSCPVLEDLVVESCRHENVASFTVNVPSLQSLIVRSTFQEEGPDNHLFVIHSHSLKLLNILDYFDGVNVIGNMSELVEANLQTLSRHENVLKSLYSVKHLSLCVDREVMFSFNSCDWRCVCV